MIKFEHTVLPSADQMDFIIEGMRNAKDSWERRDSFKCLSNLNPECSCCENRHTGNCCNGYILGPNDERLMKDLKKGGPEHRKYMRMMPVMVRITAPLYWWKEFDTYKIGVVRNSCSTMHTLHRKGVYPDAFSHEWIDEVAKERPYIFKDYCAYLDDIERLRNLFNSTKEKKFWYAMIQMLPDGFMLTANIKMNYEVIYNQKCQRAHHKQEEWSGQDGYLAWASELPYQILL